MLSIKTIILDIGGVLINIHPEKTLNFFENITELSINQLQESIIWDIYYQYEIGKLDNPQFYSAINNLFPEEKKISEGDFWRGWKLLLGEQTRVVNLLTNLYETMPIWLLSNTNPWHIQYLKSCSEYYFHKFITGAIYSYDVGYRKPDKTIYNLTMEKIGISGEEILFIDDDQGNVKAANEIGINAIVYEGMEKLIASLAKFKISENNYLIN
ncbi:MAG TPA: HAD family phosphatase [Candidatus Marinimicrobia bacterium]|nr:HAD family phosphatase [Candidatus Neomarinimicrobiota bacterium]